MLKLTRVFLAVLVLGACSKDASEPVIEEPEEIPSTAAVTLTPDSLSLMVGDSMKLSVSVRDLPSAEVEFSTSNDEVIAISATGLAYAMGEGVALITATSKVKPGAVDATLITVKGRPSPNKPVMMPTIGTGFVRAYTTGEVAVAGNYAYTTTVRGANKTYVWDIRPIQPVMVDSLAHDSVFYVGDAHVSDDGSLLLISTDFGAHAGVSVYSLANPAKPQLLDRWIGDLWNDTILTSRRGTHTAKWGRVNGKLFIFGAYVPEVVIIDASNPRDLKPVKVLKSADEVNYTHDVLVRDGMLFTADWANGVGIWDISGTRGGSPANPVLISRYKPAGTYMHNFWWMHDQKTGSKQYLFVGEEGPGFFPKRTTGDVHVLDISNIDQPREVAFYHVDPGTTSNGEPAGAHNFWADEQSGILYAAFYNGGVRAIDTRGDLATCERFQRSRDGRCDLRLMGREAGIGLTDRGSVGIWGVVWKDGKVYASDMLQGLRVLDASQLRR